MAITGTDRGVGTHNTAAASFTLAPVSNLDADSMAVLVVAFDNGGTNGGLYSSVGVTDTLGNTWTRRLSPIADPSNQYAGVEGGVWTTSQDGGALTTGTTITVTFTGGTGPTAKAWTIMEVVPTAGASIVFGTGNWSQGVSDTPSITTSSIASGDMVIGCGFRPWGTEETITGDSDTANGTWSTAQTAEVGSASTGMSVVSQRKVVTATATQTYNLTYSAGDYQAIGWISLTEEVAPQTVTPASIASTLAFGTATLAVLATVTPSSIASTLAFGTAAAVQSVTPSGIASTATLGAPTLTVVATVTPSSITSTAALGTAVAATVVAPSGIASTAALGAATATASYTVTPASIASTLSFGSPSLLAALTNSMSANHRPTAAEYRRMAYLSNGWDKVKRWDGRTAALEDAGIAGPSADLDSWTPSPTQAAGSCEIGVHVVRYRYLDSKTGYVSNPSEEREVEVTSTNGQLTFAINTSTATNIIRSTDSKVDRIVIEMTVLGGSDFFKAAEGLNSASTIVVSISDAELETQFLAWDDDGHDVPPVAKYIVSHRDRLWLFGQVTHSTGTASFTNADVDVDEGSTDPDWRATALGDSTASPATYPSVAWFIQKDGDSAVYEIDTYDESANKIILKSAYQGSTTANAGYQIFSRANVIWLSRPGYPESYEPLKFINGPNNEMAGDITAGVGYGSSMLFYSLSSCFKLAWDQDPLIDPVIVPLSNKYGALNQRVVVEVEGRVYAMDRLGWSVWEGVFPRMISRPVDAIRSLIDYDRAANFHAVFFPGLRAIRWFVCYTGETYPKHYVQYDVDTQQWSTGETYQGISESRLVPTSTGPRVLYGDENGHTWFADVGTCDGCDEDDSHLTVGVGSTTTVIAVDETLPTTGVGLGGCYLVWIKGDGTREYRLISSNTTGAITVSSAFSGSPADGDALWVGPIPSLLKTRAYAARGTRKKKIRPRRLTVEFTPETGTRYVQVRAYDDLSGTAKTWASGTRNNLEGVTWPGNNVAYPTTDFLGNLAETDGQWDIPVGSEFRRYVEVELECEEPDATVEIVTLELDGSNIEDTRS